MHPITNTKLPNTVNYDDVRKFAREFDKITGHHSNKGSLSWDDYTICESKVIIYQIVDLEIPVRDAGGDHVPDLMGLFITQGM